MPEIVYTTASREAIRRQIELLPAVLAGHAPDPYGVARAFKLRVAFAFFSTIKQAFITKARGGTDEAGLSWPPLSAKYLAYQRPLTGRKPPRGGGLAPGGKDGLLTKQQLAQWRKIFSQVYAINAARMSAAEAKSLAAAVAWTRLKEQGARTKLQTFGRREVEILRDRGILFNSLSPGILSGGRLAVSYGAPPGQLVDADRPGELSVGTTVEYAKYHHGDEGKGRRPLWPQPESWPAAWWDGWLNVATQSFLELSREMAA